MPQYRVSILWDHSSFLWTPKLVPVARRFSHSIESRSCETIARSCEHRSSFLWHAVSLTVSSLDPVRPYLVPVATITRSCGTPFLSQYRALDPVRPNLVPVETITRSCGTPFLSQYRVSILWDHSSFLWTPKLVPVARRLNSPSPDSAELTRLG